MPRTSLKTSTVPGARCSRALAPAQRRHPAEDGVGLKIAGRGQPAERRTRGLPFFFRIGLPVRHRRQTLRGKSLGIKLQLP